MSDTEYSDEQPDDPPAPPPGRSGDRKASPSTRLRSPTKKSRLARPTRGPEPRIPSG